MKRLLAALLVGALSLAASATPKTLRVSLRVAETGFDPAKVTDFYSRSVLAHILEAPYGYDPLATPYRIVPLTAADLPEVSADQKTWTVRLRPGIHFAAHPAFGDQPRELVAEDYAYSIKRFADPAVNSPGWKDVEALGLVGLKAYRAQLLQSKAGFDYAKPIAGLQALDRHTLRFQLEQPNPRFLFALASGDIFGAVAREVVEAHADDTMAHPVGTGPFVLKEWKRSSRLVLERNPGYRDRRYEAQPAAGDAAGQAILAQLQGRRLPMVDRVEVAVIEETQPRWLSFLQGDFDIVSVPEEFVPLALPHGRLAPNLAQQGMQLHRSLGAETLLLVFNMDDPVVGGLSPQGVALRRAIGLGTDLATEFRAVRRGQAVPAQGFYFPHTSGFDPAFKSLQSEYDPAKAKGLLDTYGYRDRDGDGWREDPQGAPLELEMLTQPTAFQRQLDEVFRKDLQALGLKLRFKSAKWAENLKASRSGGFQLWTVTEAAHTPDGLEALAIYHGPQVGGKNLARFQLPEMDALFEQIAVLPDGPERATLMRRSERLAAALMPYKTKGRRIYNTLTGPRLVGFRSPVFQNNWWDVVDLKDPS